MQSMVDRNTALCLACSSSLPPRSSPKPSELFTTSCCHRPICPNCISSNPRLARYDPCLACLAGVRVIQNINSSHEGKGGGRHKGKGNFGSVDRDVMNVDGSIREQDLFVLGDDEEDAVELENYNNGEEKGEGGASRGGMSPPPAYPLRSSSPDPDNGTSLNSPTPPERSQGVPEIEPAAPPKYHIKRSDTLLGIAFRFKIDAFELCRLNNLPRSTLNTTPHLLHTRTFLNLPPSSSMSSRNPPLVGLPSRVLERAQKRLQTVTKEVDWHIAKAYVALAEDEGDDIAKKEDGTKANTISREGSRTLEARAIDRYLDDTEWEENERREGRGVSVQSFPFGEFGGKKTSSGSARGSIKWPWSLW